MSRAVPNTSITTSLLCLGAEKGTRTRTGEDFDDFQTKQIAVMLSIFFNFEGISSSSSSRRQRRRRHHRRRRRRVVIAGVVIVWEIN